MSDKAASRAPRLPNAVYGGSVDYWEWIHALEDDIERRHKDVKADVTWSYRDFDFAIVRLVLWHETRDKGVVGMIGDVDIGHACGPEHAVVFRPREEILREVEEVLKV